MKNRFWLHLTIDVIQEKKKHPKHDTTNLVLEMELLEKLNRTLT